ncbi:MAG: LCP family protein [Chloroflexi bacterium]|nr:LCP family protein [Chloroflexota bacterium]
MLLLKNRLFIIVTLDLAILLAACGNANTTPTLDPFEFQTRVAQNVAATFSAAPPTLTLPPTQVTPSPAAESSTPTPAATAEPSSTPGPTARSVLDPTLGYYAITPENTPVTAVPSAVPRIKLEDDVKNILLVGSDTSGEEYRSDTMIVVSINATAKTVTMLSIPRDLYVFIPKSLVQMGRINSVINVARNAPEGPLPLLEQTILYNLGIPIHYYARVDFESFKAIVDALGGVDIPVTCAFQEWRLKDPALDPEVADNWDLFTLNAGVQHLDGSTALWYARGRQVGRAGSGSDFDRARRQQEVLRAMFIAARNQNFLNPVKVAELYQQFSSAVETDMTLGDVLQFLPLAASLDELNIRSYKISPPYTQGWSTPGNASVQLPVPDEFYKYVQRVMTAGSSNRASQNPFVVEIWNGSTWADADDLAAYRLRLDGLAVTLGAADRANYPATTLIDYTTSAKASPVDSLKKLLRITDPANIIAQPDPNSPVQFRVILGADYNSCTYQVAPLTTLTPSPVPASLPTVAETATPSP